MSLRIWEQRRRELQPYRRRRPETTILYRIVSEERYHLEWQWEECYQEWHGFWRPVVGKTLDAYLNCGIPELGVARIRCEQCGVSEVIPFSCKKRVCPSCAAKRALLFAEHLHEGVLAPVEHRHIGFGVPKRIRGLFRRNRKLLGILPVAAAESVREMYQELKPDGVPGLVLTVQTAGDFLNWNPHLHGLVALGLFDQAGSFLKLPPLATGKLERLFGHKVLAALLKQKLISEETVEQILSQKHSGFNAWLGEEITPTDEGFRLFLSRYIDRCPLTNSGLTLEGDRIKYTAKDKFQLFTPLDFLALLSTHIANHYESVVRMYGAYSYRFRGEQKKKNLPSQSDTDKNLTVISDPNIDKKKASKSWAALIKKVFEVDPLICPKCGGVMKIKAFIINQHEVKRLLENLGIPSFIKPLPLRSTAPPPPSSIPPLPKAA